MSTRPHVSDRYWAVQQVQEYVFYWACPATLAIPFPNERELPSRQR